MMKLGIKILLLFIPSLVFGQIDLTPPFDTALIFLPNSISTKNHEHSSPSINNENQIICWSMWERPKPENPRQLILFMDLKYGKTFKVADFSKDYSNGGPIWIGHDKILFYSNRPSDSKKTNEKVNDLWIVEKKDSIWSQPKCLNFSKYTKFAVSPTITKSGTIYFVGFKDSVENSMGIFRAVLKPTGYEIPELLPKEINSKYFDWTPYISPDESYLIFSSNRLGGKDNYGDLYISFKDIDNNWSVPINMGNKINTNKQERFPKISENGQILFFTRATDNNYDDIFWISSKIIDDIKNQKTIGNNVYAK